MDDSGWFVRLNEAFSASGLTQAELGRLSCISKAHISEILSGKKKPTIPLFLAMCEAMNISPAYIVSGLDVTLEDERLLRDWKILSQDTRRAVLVLIQSQLSGGLGK